MYVSNLSERGRISSMRRNSTPLSMGRVSIRDQVQSGLRAWPIWPVVAISGALTVGMIAIATQFRPIADDYIHIGRVMQMGILPSTIDWFLTFLPGFFGVLLISLFTGLYGSVPDSLAYVPYTMFLVGILYFVGLTALFPFTQSLRVSTPWLLAVAFPSLWLLSMGNLFPEYDIINTFGMMSWISNGYRAHLPLLILVFFFWMNWWRGSNLIGFLVGLFGMVFLTLNFLNALPDIAAYFALALGTAGYYAWHRMRQRGSSKSPVIFANLGMAAGSLAGLAILLLSPGTTSRTDEIPVQFSLESAIQIIPYQTIVFLREMMNVSHAIVFGAAITMGIIVSQLRGGPIQRIGLSHLKAMSTQAIVLTFLLIGTGVIGETLTYAAIFHRWVVLQIEFVAIVLVGLWIGALIALQTPKLSTQRWPYAMMVGALLTALVPLVNVANFAAERKRAWESGQPAPVSYMVDREQLMLRDWWNVIEEQRAAGR